MSSRPQTAATRMAAFALLAGLATLALGGCDALQSGASGSRSPGRSPVASSAELDALDGMGDRPERIVLIVVDTLRRDALNCYGGNAKTPNLDALAARSQIFQNAHSSYYQTSMSMGALFTGRTPSLESGKSMEPIPFSGQTWCGLARFSKANQKTCVPDSIPTLAQVVGQRGYWTIGVASNGFVFQPYGIDRGFDDWTEMGRRMLRSSEMTPEIWDAVTESRAAEHVNRAAKNALIRRKSDRFFLYVHYMDIHDYKGGTAEYLANLEILDAAIGDLFERLESAKLMEGTTIILTADHGERLGEEHFTKGGAWHAGNPAFDELLRVPLLVSPPVSDDDAQLMRTEDVFRLITSIAGSDIEVEAELAPDELFVSEPSYQTYKRGKWKSYLRRDDGTHFLIDLEADPNELVNAAEANPEIVVEHEDRIAELAQKLSTADTFSVELTEEDRRRLRELGYAE